MGGAAQIPAWHADALADIESDEEAREDEDRVALADDEDGPEDAGERASERIGAVLAGLAPIRKASPEMTGKGNGRYDFPLPF
jgi:hypothetical protein